MNLELQNDYYYVRGNEDGHYLRFYGGWCWLWAHKHMLELQHSSVVLQAAATAHHWSSWDENVRTEENTDEDIAILHTGGDFFSVVLAKC